MWHGDTRGAGLSPHVDSQTRRRESEAEWSHCAPRLRLPHFPGSSVSAPSPCDPVYSVLVAQEGARFAATLPFHIHGFQPFLEEFTYRMYHLLFKGKHD